MFVLCCAAAFFFEWVATGNAFLFWFPPLPQPLFVLESFKNSCERGGGLDGADAAPPPRFWAPNLLVWLYPLTFVVPRVHMACRTHLVPRVHMTCYSVLLRSSFGGGAHLTINKGLSLHLTWERIQVLGADSPGVALPSDVPPALLPLVFPGHVLPGLQRRGGRSQTPVLLHRSHPFQAFWSRGPTILMTL